MSLFKPAENTMAFLKAGIMGEAGSGKTHTATLLAIGLVKYLRANKLPGHDKPAFMLDTENGSSWIKPMFDEAGIELRVAKTRAFKDLVPAVNDAEKNASILLIDSLTHYWQELQDSYLKVLSERRHRQVSAFEFQDWAWLKRQWGGFSDRFVASNLHCILSGRLGWEYDQVTNERGKKEIEKSGVKMQAEKGIGYEPNILVWMERNLDLHDKVVARTATVLKDRSRKLDGKQFANPTFETFLPHIQFMALGGKHETPDINRNSDDMMPGDEAPLSDMKSIRRKIVLDEIQALLVEKYPSTSAEDKKQKAALIKENFGTTSWTEIETLMPLVDLQSNFDKLHRTMTGKPSRYGVTEAAAEAAAAQSKGAADDAAHLDDLIGERIAAAAPIETAPTEQVAATPALSAAETSQEPEPDEALGLVLDLRADFQNQHNGVRVNECWRRWAGKYKAASEATRLLMENEHEQALKRVKRAAA